MKTWGQIIFDLKLVVALPRFLMCLHSSSFVVKCVHLIVMKQIFGTNSCPSMQCVILKIDRAEERELNSKTNVEPFCWQGRRDFLIYPNRVIKAASMGPCDCLLSPCPTSPPLPNKALALPQDSTFLAPFWVEAAHFWIAYVRQGLHVISGRP